jgi:two-component system response regulator MprA
MTADGAEAGRVGLHDPGIGPPSTALPTTRRHLGGSRAVDDLLARMRVRLHRQDYVDGEVIRFGDLALDTRTREVRRRARRIELTCTEFNLLELFLRNPRRVLTRSQIFTDVWGFDFGAMSNSLNVYVGYLRRKTEAAGEPRLIHTVRGVGYVLREP